MKDTATDLGVGDSFRKTPVAVYFGEPGKTVKDPYFGGEGPDRTGCVFCGGCMVGCRHGAKNTLDKNYLWLAERRGAEVIPETRVDDVREDGRGGYVVETRRATSLLGRPRRTFRARGVVFSAGVGIGSLLCENIEEMIDPSEVILVGLQQPALDAALQARVKPQQYVIDLVNLPNRDLLKCRYEGACW